MINKGQWVLLPALVLLDEKDLRLSPLGVVPRRDRQPSTIYDDSFFLINDDTIELCPEEPMQFCPALLCILQQIACSDPRLGSVFLSKIDIADGFYLVAIRSDNMPKLGIAFPARPGEEPWIGLPLVLPMRWRQSPPMFTATMKTVSDLDNACLLANDGSSPHLLELVSELPVKLAAPLPPMVDGHQSSPLPPLRQCPVHRHPRPVKNWDVYVDQFIGAVQGNSKQRRHVKKVLLESLHSVLRPLDQHDGLHQQELASVKKMLKGDATWSTWKVVLGWMIHTCAMTIQLTARQVLRLFEILDSIAPDPMPHYG
jgi:hypothetical protein